MKNNNHVKRLAAGNALRLICLPYAGGGARAFRSFAGQLPSDWEILSVDPPGHESNRHAFLDDFKELVDFYRQAFEFQSKLPIVLFGYSLGGLAAYDIAQRLCKEGLLPLLVVIGGCLPPHERIREEAKWYAMSDAEVIHDLEEMQYTPPELLQNQEFLDYLLPVIRADSKILASFNHMDRDPLPVPLLVLGGTEDLGIPPEKLANWRDVEPSANIRLLNGSHMFLHSAEEQVAREIRHCIETELRSVSKAGP